MPWAHDVKIAMEDMEHDDRISVEEALLSEEIMNEEFRPRMDCNGFGSPAPFDRRY